jgi:hypothetical protein
MGGDLRLETTTVRAVEARTIAMSAQTAVLLRVGLSMILSS